MKKQIVCHLTSVHPYNDTRILYKECQSLVEAGYEVTLVAPVDTPMEEFGVQILPAGRWSNRWKRLFLTVPRLLKTAIRCDADLYHFHDPELLLIAPILRLTGAVVVYDVHEDYVTSIRQKTYLPAWLRFMVAKLIRIFEKVMTISCAKVIAEKYYNQIFPDAVPVLNYPLVRQPNKRVEVDLNLFDPKYDWLFYSGNVHPDRGALTQLKILEADSKSALAYIGKCSSAIAEMIMRELEEKGIDKQRVQLIGIDTYVPREIIDSYMTKGKWLAGIALFPKTEHYYQKELTKFFEYMSAGLPILASDFPVWKALIEKEGVGLCVPVDDSEAIKKAVAYFKENPKAAHAMGEKGKKAAFERYTWDKEAVKLVEMYRRLLGERK